VRCCGPFRVFACPAGTGDVAAPAHPLLDLHPRSEFLDRPDIALIG